MTDYISRDAAINAVYEAYADGESAYDALEKLPAADVRPVVRGKWREEMVVGGFAESWESTCSICGKRYRDIGKPHFCPNCGAWMEES